MSMSYNEKIMNITLDIQTIYREGLKNIKNKVDASCFTMKLMCQRKQLEIENESLNTMVALGEHSRSVLVLRGRGAHNLAFTNIQ